MTRQDSDAFLVNQISNWILHCSGCSVRTDVGAGGGERHVPRAQPHGQALPLQGAPPYGQRYH